MVGGGEGVVGGGEGMVGGEGEMGGEIFAAHAHVKHTHCTSHTSTPSLSPSLSLCAGNFAPGKSNGSIMKKSDKTEREALQRLMLDPLKEFVPEFLGEVEVEGESILVYGTDPYVASLVL